MPSINFVVIVFILGLTIYTNVSARPQSQSISSVRIVRDGILPRNFDTSTYIEMKRTKLLRGQYSYTLGKRVDGDKLAHQEEDSDDYPAARDVEAKLTYPKSGTGYTLTYISILVEQSSEDGFGYVTNGGINQKFAEVLIVANSTTHYAHSGSFYGY